MFDERSNSETAKRASKRFCSTLLRLQLQLQLQLQLPSTATSNWIPAFAVMTGVITATSSEQHAT